MKNYNRKKRLFALLLTLGITGTGNFFGGITNLYAREIVLGGKDGWPALEKMDNITTGSGRFGYTSLTLDTNSFRIDEYTDLLIDFENPDNPILWGNYSIEKNELQNSRETNLGKLCGLSRNTGGIDLMGKDGAFFGTEGFSGSFSIEFWLNPSLVENGEVIFQWHTSRALNNHIIYQMIAALFEQGKLQWNLTSFFDDQNPDHKEITLKGTTTIIPDVWSYHVLSFDCESGMLQYLMNGFVEDLCFITETGHEGGNVYLPVRGVPANVSLCPDYTGKIDDLRITTKPFEMPPEQSADNAGSLERMKYIRRGGKFISNPIMVSQGSVLKKIDSEYYEPQETEVNFYVRSGDNHYNWTDTYPEWKEVKPGQEISGVTGMYFQVMCELFPDGNGYISPSVTSISLSCTELPEPLPPFSLRAKAGDGSVTLTWGRSVDETCGGYYLYYGNRSGEYLGRIAVEGSSPVNVGNKTTFTLTGLENGTIYYFAVAAWSVHNENVVGQLSKEVFARPKKNN